MEDNYQLFLIVQVKFHQTLFLQMKISEQKKHNMSNNLKMKVKKLHKLKPKSTDKMLEQINRKEEKCEPKE